MGKMIIEKDPSKRVLGQICSCPVCGCIDFEYVLAPDTGTVLLGQLNFKVRPVAHICRGCRHMWTPKELFLLNLSKSVAPTTQVNTRQSSGMPCSPVVTTEETVA